MTKKNNPTHPSGKLTENQAGILRKFAEESGATKSVILRSSDIIIEDALAGMCLEPKCRNYGLSKSCPPNVSGPSGFRKKLKTCETALFFKIDVPKDILFSSDRKEIFQLLHQIGAGIEQKAVSMGYTNSRAFAGGSCKSIFCETFKDCAVLSGKGHCRNPKAARQSMSGFGVNVSKLMETAGWSLKTDSGEEPDMSHVCGLILIY